MPMRNRPPTPIGLNANTVSSTPAGEAIASMRASSASSGCRPRRSACATSIAVAQKSPIFCWSLPGAAFCAAADSLMPRRRAYSSSSTSLPMPHAASDAGIGCAFSQPPFAYWKKSTPGSTDVSMCAARKSCGAGASAAKAPPEANASAADSSVTRREVVRRAIGRSGQRTGAHCPGGARRRQGLEVMRAVGDGGLHGLALARAIGDQLQQRRQLDRLGHVPVETRLPGCAPCRPRGRSR